MTPRRKVLVAGVSGLVGYAAAKRFSRDPLWDVVGLARRRPERLEHVETVSVDLTDRAACHTAISALTDVTHVVYAALYEKPGLVGGWVDRDQMDTNLGMLQNLLDPLLSASPVEHISLLQGSKAYGVHLGPMKAPGREREPRHQHENFYWLQQDDLLARQKTAAFAWTVMRPQVIFGEALSSNFNSIAAIGIYAALQRERGQALDYPGGRAVVAEGVDSDLLADALFWAATAPGCRNEIFNITNGDVFSMENVWPTIADAFGMEVGEQRPISLAEDMPARQEEWEKVHARFGLCSPRDLSAFVGQSFIYADLLLGYGIDEYVPAALISTIKARQAGFAECMDTEDMFRKWIAHFQRIGLLPPRTW